MGVHRVGLRLRVGVRAQHLAHASKRMSNPNNKNKRLKNRNKNEKLRAEGQHPKQLRNKANLERHAKNVEAANANQAPLA